MALDTIAKMVKAAGPAQIQPHLAHLSVTMLESLSSMEVRDKACLAALPVFCRNVTAMSCS